MPTRRTVKRKRYPDTIGIVADLHCGSRAGLRDPSRHPDYPWGGTDWLWENWCWLIKHWPKLDLLILNGDLIDGTQHRSDSTGLVTVSLEEQTDIAIECLQPLARKATKVIRTIGTPYHEGFHGALGKLDATFGITPPDDPTKGFVRDIKLRPVKLPGLAPRSVILNVKHQPEGDAALYRGTVADRETIWAVIGEQIGNLPIADILIRSHIHSWTYFGGALGKRIEYTPAWQLQSGYATSKRRYRWQPTIGGTLIERDDLAEHGYRVTTTTFPLPPVEADNYANI